VLGGAVAARNDKNVTTVGSTPGRVAPPDSVSGTLANSAKGSMDVGRHDVLTVFC